MQILRFADALALVRNEFTGLDAHQMYRNAFSRLLKPDPLGRVLMMGTCQRDRFVPELRTVIERAVPRGGHILDVGAGDGQTFGLVADAVPEGTCVSIEEPNPDYVAAYDAYLRSQAHLRPGLSLVAGFDEIDEGVATLGGCDSVEALRQIGLVQYERGRYDDARRALEQYTELMPRNRCRPSFNRLLREATATFDNVRLVDLAAKADALSPHGIAGSELFDDYCHMNWIGYAAMADEVLAALVRERWVPRGTGVRPSREELRVRFGLVENPKALEQ